MKTTPPTFLFITGAPRTGTTFLSDWITKTSNAYAVHEVMEEIEGKKEESLINFLNYCAKSGHDRYSKSKQLEFLNWKNLNLKNNPPILGLKQPVVWENTYAPPEVISNFLSLKPIKKILLIRHPYDVIASGKHRGNNTNNWPNYSTVTHCKFWQTSFNYINEWTNTSGSLLLIFWEKLVLNYNAEKKRIEDFLRIELDSFWGFEKEQIYFEKIKAQVSITEGVINNSKRQLLSEEDKKIIKDMLFDNCEFLNYKM